MPTTYAPGIKPIHRKCEERPTCPDHKFQCSWDYELVNFGPGNWGYFLLKFINLSCSIHKSIPHTAIPMEIHYGQRYKTKADRRRSYN
jgi:hypothetical protein